MTIEETLSFTCEIGILLSCSNLVEQSIPSEVVSAPSVTVTVTELHSSTNKIVLRGVMQRKLVERSRSSALSELLATVVW